MPDTIKQLPKNLLETPIIPLLKDKKNKTISTWVTEISDITPLDVSMQDGLHWAKIFNNYLETANVNAIIWWAGAQPASNNESLILLDNDRIHFKTTKRYDVFGNYSRYIPRGSSRIQTSCNNNKIHVSSFKKGKTCIWVIINDSKESSEILLSVNKGKSINSLCSYTTTAELQWDEKKEVVKKGIGKVTIPAMSVVTYVGTIK